MASSRQTLALLQIRGGLWEVLQAKYTSTLGWGYRWFVLAYTPFTLPSQWRVFRPRLKIA